MKKCSWCDSEFVGVKGQRYCSDLCRNSSVNESNLKRREEARVKRRQKSKPVCKSCGATLSIYGHGTTCSICFPNSLSDIIRDINKIVRSHEDSNT